MSKIQENLILNMSVLVNQTVSAELVLCNTGQDYIIIPDDTILLNGMYRKYPFKLSGDLNSKCEIDSSGYKVDSKKLLPQECTTNTWYLDRECDFRDIHGNYTLEFKQDIECIDKDGMSQVVMIGADSTFIL